jgi:hypothetical protein
MVNEFMSYCLERPPEDVRWYLGNSAPSRLLQSWRSQDLPPQDAQGKWPLLENVFETEAEAFSEYVNQRWGLWGGRVAFVNVD